jgi:hypothetical protein
VSDPAPMRADTVDGCDAATDLPFLSRWSRLKRGLEVPRAGPPARAGAVSRGQAPVPAASAPACATAAAPDSAAASVTAPTPAANAAATSPPLRADPIDPRTGKPMSELTDADMPDVESLDENADLACFMAAKVSRALRMKALTKVFHSAKFNQVCLCAEYADDYTAFAPLGDVVPHELREAIAREAARLCERLAERGVQLDLEAAQARIAAEFRGEPVPPIDALCAATLAAGGEPALPSQRGPRDPQPERGLPPGKPETT